MRRHYTTILTTIILGLALFLGGYHLEATQSFVGDTARDTLRILELYQQRELTLIGPPLSLGYGTTRELYFGSFSLYLGMLGLLFTNFEPVGAALPNIFLLLFSLPILTLLLQALGLSRPRALAGTALFAFSPAVIFHTRFFWNPNPILPLAIIFWYLLVTARQGARFATLRYFFAGGILGIIFNLHYLGILGGVGGILLLLFGRQLRSLFWLLAGLFTTSLPLIAFELRHSFYLTQALWWNLQHGQIWDLAVSTSPLTVWATPWLSLLGLSTTEMSYPLLSAHFPPLLLFGLACLLTLALLRTAWRLFATPSHRPYLLTLGAGMVILSLAQLGIHTRYWWSLYPLLIWVMTATLFTAPLLRLKIYLVLTWLLGNSLLLVLTPRPSTNTLISLSDLRQVGALIAARHPTGAYNLMDSVTGDARGVALRYYVVRSGIHPPHNILSYRDLDTLFVLAPDWETVVRGQRWEFTATPNLVVVATYPVGINQLFELQRQPK